MFAVYHSCNFAVEIYFVIDIPQSSRS